MECSSTPHSYGMLFNLMVGCLFAALVAVLVVVFSDLLQSLKPKPQPVEPVQVHTRVEHQPVTKELFCEEREYRIERNGNFTPSEKSVRSNVWNKHPTWHIPSLEREKIQVFSGIDDILAILEKYDVSPHRGFLPNKDPLQRLPNEKYYLWEDMADDLPKLLGARLGQVREPLCRLPVISTDELKTVEELRRAQLLLCLFAHAFVWGGTPVMEYVPKGISIPLWEVSCRLDTPPILMNMAITLYNWRRLDPHAAISMMNLSTLNNFFSGRDESWFYLITVEIEAIGAGAVVPLMQLNADIKRATSATATQISGGAKHVVRNVILLESITSKLLVVAECIDKMVTSLSTMREGCHPFIFYHRVRPFLAGWKSNPALPNGVKYEGVYVKWSDRARPPAFTGEQGNIEPSGTEKAKSWFSLGSNREGGLDECPAQYFSGGSAAQSALLPFLDICLGVDHTDHDKSPNSNGFLKSMREYMPRPHREFLEYMEGKTCIRGFMVSCQKELVQESLSRGLSPPKKMSLLNDLQEQADSSVDSVLKEEKQEDGETDTADSENTSSVTWTWRGEGGEATAVTADDGLDERVYDALQKLCDAYDSCLTNLGKFRTAHISLVAEYILAQQRHGFSDKSIEGNAGGKGTGGTDLINFLKPIRDNCNVGVLKQPSGAEQT
eukprot:CAMPEP_0185028784 /NCGR_PEP_ID=MMETSP1103-20130426/14774_1 /TAXON_ID=36769 /ORGANISM="Paraphysomonas bandaiensis, Strain Caron Lab Isolate" /LENGTH=666 /DNA_ID=CAMNT_0027563311 /DNA_START=1 /DNA_END=2001 /DNA_ORIENTATION=-